MPSSGLDYRGLDHRSLMTSVNAQLAADLRENLLSLGMIVAVAAPLNFMMSNTVMNRIEAVVDTVRRLNSGDLERRAPGG